MSLKSSTEGCLIGGFSARKSYPRQLVAIRRAGRKAFSHFKQFRRPKTGLISSLRSQPPWCGRCSAGQKAARCGQHAVPDGTERAQTWTHLRVYRFNREGDLLISCAKDLSASLWRSEDGLRIGTFEGHKGTIWTCDITWDSSKLLTGSGDSSAKLWDMETGKDLFTFKYHEPCRAVAFSLGDGMAAISSDPFIGAPAAIHLVTIAEDPADQEATVLQSLKGPTEKGRFQRVAWTDLNRTLISAGEDGYVRRWDVETGKVKEEREVHGGQINDIRFSADGTHFVTASADMTAKLIDTLTLEVLKTYKTDRPVNSADISPIFDHILIGGGQEASQVTLTSSRSGKFESKFYHKVYAEEFGTVRGHFGPINAVAYHPDGQGFVTGGEDGYIRLHRFDNDYLSNRFF